MPVPQPKSLFDGAQDASDMIESLGTAPAFSGSALDAESTALVYVERIGFDERGQAVREAAHVDASDRTAIKLEMVTEGTGKEPTRIRKDIHAKTVVRMRVTDKMENSMGNMHGGCGATLVDNLSSMTLYLHTSGVPGSPWSFLGVSQNINVFYLNACPIGSVVEIESYSAQVGKSIALLQTDIWIVKRTDGQPDDGEGRLDGKGWTRTVKTVSGTHTKVDNSASFKL
ncbi:uncharacterized protein PFL1_00142 [Pseudozyma flocculosa PF-1]|uniref:Thioesterase domain-containing protein n=1 Tax=Pseudozyma flocculosa TaxID=84751 RepID=A0A5C3ES57_9BASI|nr:uncharacterized protein PFL1_00142 [Pseudozyma flocculosa PF-1]EPQ31943.1 hypothetical protein PFL1_00142 [Pseudozyma flocculosa PF-1]SPO35144.1 uncharacterized protein PSFLO_00615 [Pseudozyma flocculosa]